MCLEGILYWENATSCQNIMWSCQYNVKFCLRTVMESIQQLYVTYLFLELTEKYCLLSTIRGIFWIQIPYSTRGTCLINASYRKVERKFILSYKNTLKSPFLSTLSISGSHLHADAKKYRERYCIYTTWIVQLPVFIST